MIKKSIQALIVESHNKMLGYVGMQGYYYAQICVKHEAASLLPLEIEYLGTTYKFEEVARAMYGEGEENDDKMYVYPNDMEYLRPIMEAICKAHPEFRQDLLTLDDEDDEEDKNGSEDAPAFGSQPTDEQGKTAGEDNADGDDGKYYYILLTMPPVTKDLRKTYLDAVDGIHQYVTAKIDMEWRKLTATVTAKTAAGPKADADECKEAVDKVHEKDKAMADQQKEEKTKEIEEAYQRYLAAHPHDQDKGGTKEKRDTLPTMPEKLTMPEAPQAPQPPQMPKAPEAPANPLEGFGIG